MTSTAQARHGRKFAQNRFAQRPGHFPVDQILQSVQIDHALADIIVVDERDRLTVSALGGLGRLRREGLSIQAYALTH